jgi:hypothetical protein
MLALWLYTLVESNEERRRHEPQLHVDISCGPIRALKQACFFAWWAPKKLEQSPAVLRFNDIFHRGPLSGGRHLARLLFSLVQKGRTRASSDPPTSD